MVSLLREPTKCEILASKLFEAYEQLAYAYQSARHHYTKDAKTHIEVALKKLKETELDEEDLMPITDPLRDVIGEEVRLPKVSFIAPAPYARSPVAIASHIDVAQHELLDLAPRWICLCEVPGEVPKEVRKRE